tara:strand:- start:216 stop:785 length:570 start_codon:yes stop_codon:yes gene_type:complete
MIYFRDKKIVIITPPHVASGNLHKALCTDKHGGTYVIGPTYNNIVDHHYARLHTGWIHDKIKVFLVVRNPFDRLYGLFLHYNEFWKNKKPELSFSDFVIKQRPPHWIYHKTISQFIRDHNIEGFEIIRFEGIEQNVSEVLEEKVSLPPAFHEPNDMRECYNRKDVFDYVVENWAQEDCEQFSYGLYGVI